MFYTSHARRTSGSVIPLGFLLVVSIIILMLMIFNTTTIPSLSKSAEIDAHRSAETDFIRMDAAVFRAATTGVPQPVVMGGRVQYPPSIAPLRTPTPYLRTIGPHNASVQNAVFASNATTFSDTRDTNSVMFSREYNFYTTARDLGYEHGIFYTQPQDARRGNTGILARDKQTIINGDSLTLITVQGNLSFSRPAPTQVTFKPDEERERHATLTNESGSNIKLILPTRMPKSEWEVTLQDEMASNGGHITGVSYQTTNPWTGEDDGMNYVTLTLESGIHYEVSLYTVDVEKY